MGGTGGGVEQLNGGGATTPSGSQATPSPANPPRLSPNAALPGAGGAPFVGARPGQAENAVQSAGAAHEANARAKTFASDMWPLEQGLQELDAAPTGKGSEAAHHISSLLQTYGPGWIQRALSFVSPVMTPEEVSAYDVAKKYLTQVQLGGPGATRSNEGLSTAGAASPSVEITPAAARLVLKGMIGLRRMEQEGTLEFNQSGLAPDAYDKFQTKFATSADPRAYMFDKFTPQQRQQIISGLSPAKRQAFIAQVERAEKNGILTAPGASQ
jgi:hypothetical protein